MLKMALITSLNNNAVQPANQVTINALPLEVLGVIFGYLSPEQLAKACRVSKLWNAVASQEHLWNVFDLKTLFPKLSILDSQVWNDHIDLNAFGLSFADAEPLNKRKVILELKRLFAVLKVEGDAGITLLTIPKGLSFNKLVKLAGCPIKGNKAAFKYIWDRITAELGDVVVQKTYRVAITNNILVGSRDKSSYVQQLLVKKFGCDKPKMIDAVALAILSFISSTAQLPLRLLSANPLTCTRCLEMIGNFPLAVGSFAPGGLHVYDSYFDHEYFGVLGCWKL